MPRQTIPIPGQILKTTVVAGLTFDELMVLGSVPLMLLLPASFIEAIPILWSLVAVGLGFVGVGVVIWQTPKGQSPVKWFPAYLNRRINPDEYVLKPRSQTRYGSPDVEYLDVVYTADMIRKESKSTVEFDEFVSQIENAEKLDPPEWAKDSSEGSILQQLLERINP